MKELSCGWLASDGSFTPCAWADHTAVAADLVDKFGYKSIERPDDTLLKHRWVKISMSLLGRKEWCIMWEGFLTEYQRYFLKDYQESEFPLSFGTICKFEMEEFNDEQV